jgi:hypothetical protein
MNARSEELVPENIIFNNVEEVPPPIYYEINQVVEKLKTHKAVGLENIPAELIKQGGIELKRRIHKLIKKIWQEETVLTEWTEGIICPIYKKGDRMICSNYRPITLLNVVYKIFTILINSRLSNIVYRKLEDCQMGFGPNRSTIDNLFIVRQIIEKCHEFNIELHNVLSSTHKHLTQCIEKKIVKCLNNYEIPSKLIKLTAKTLQDT